MQKDRYTEFSSYGLLLTTLVLVSLAYPVLQQYQGLRILTGFLFVATLLVALRAIARKKRQLVIASAITLIGIAGFAGEFLGLGIGWRIAYLLGFFLFFLFASLLMALLYLGGEMVQIELGLPLALTGLFQGMLLFFLLACDVLIGYRIRVVNRVSAGGLEPVLLTNPSEHA